MYYTVIKHSGHLRTLEKCKKHDLGFFISYLKLGNYSSGLLNISGVSTEDIAALLTRVRLLFYYVHTCNENLLLVVLLTVTAVLLNNNQRDDMWV